MFYETFRIFETYQIVRHKTFTIRKYVGGKLFSKFRTEAMSNDEFEDSKMNTESDWSDFLGYGSYSVVR